MAVILEQWPDLAAWRGGQHVGTGPAGVKITHTIGGHPTGIEASCVYHRSQHKNKMVAMQMIEWACAECKLPVDG